MPRPGRLATTKSCWDSPALHCNAAPRASACPSPAHWAPPAAPWHVPPPCRNPYALRSVNVCPCAMKGDPSARSGTCREEIDLLVLALITFPSRQTHLRCMEYRSRFICSALIKCPSLLVVLVAVGLLGGSRVVVVVVSLSLSGCWRPQGFDGLLGSSSARMRWRMKVRCSGGISRIS